MHHSVRKLEDALRRMDGYSTLERAADRGVRPAGLVRHRASRAASFAFLRAYVLQLGFLNGAVGFLHAVAVAEGTYYRYMKAWIERGIRADASPLREVSLDAVAQRRFP